MRAFVALEISSDEVLGQLVSFQSELASAGADLKLVERQNLHFTLKFLGEITEAQARAADEKLQTLHLGSSDITVAGAGAFPSSRRPSVVWAGVERENEASVGAIARAVLGALQGIGERDDRPFQAHVTLARLRQGGSVGRLADVISSNSGRKFGTYKLSTFRLKSSTLTPRGPIYSDIGVYSLS